LILCELYLQRPNHLF